MTIGLILSRLCCLRLSSFIFSGVGGLVGFAAGFTRCINPSRIALGERQACGNDFDDDVEIGMRFVGEK